MGSGASAGPEWPRDSAPESDFRGYAAALDAVPPFRGISSAPDSVCVRDGLAGWGREDSNLCISESEFAKTLPSRRQDSKLCISESEFAKTLSSGPEHSTVGCGAKASNDCKIHEDRLDGVHHVCSPMLGTRADVVGNRCRRSSPAASSH
jgi:hypothetical protein